MRGPLEGQIIVRKARPDDAGALAYVHVATWQAAYREMLPAGFLEALTPAARVAQWQGRLAQVSAVDFTFVAEAITGEPTGAGRVIGFVAGGPERDGIAGYDHEIWAIYLLPEYWRLGIGRRLLAHAASWIVEQGGRSALVWVLKDNRRARGFYEALGAHLLPGEKPITIGSTNLLEVAYGWPDATDLAGGVRARR